MQAIETATGSQLAVGSMQVISSEQRMLHKRALSLDDWLNAGGTAPDLGLHANIHATLTCGQKQEG